MEHRQVNLLPLIALIVGTLNLGWFGSSTWTQTAEADPVGQCAEGIRLYNDGKIPEALPLLEAGFEGRDRVASPTDLGTCALTLGYIRFGQRDFDRALTVFQVALTTFRETQNRAGEGIILSNMGWLHLILGQYSEALMHYQQALSIHREVGNRVQEGDALNKIGNVYVVQERYTDAEDSYNQARTISDQIGDRGAQSNTLRNLGNMYRLQGKYSQALEILQQGLAIDRELGNRASEATTLNDIGLVYRWQKQSSEALGYYLQALTIYRELRDRVNEGLTLSNIGRAYRDLGQNSEALEHLQQALIIDREVDNRAQEGLTLANIGRVHQDLGQDGEALEVYIQAMDVLEEARAVAGDDIGRAGFINQYVPLYERASTLAHQLNQYTLAFDVSERARARAFLDSLASGKVQLSDDDAKVLLEREQAMHADRWAIQEALAGARALDQPKPTLVADLEQQLQVAERQHAAAVTAIEQRGAELAALIPSRTQSVLAVNTVQQRLDPQTTLLSFFVTQDQTLAFVLTRDSFQTLTLPLNREALRGQIRTLLDAPAFKTTAHPAMAVQLYNALITPLKPHLTTPHLVVVPHGPLHYLPFAALSDGRHFLGDDYLLSTLPSASTLPFIQARTGRSRIAPLILGNPDGSLRFAEQEARTIGRLHDVQPLLGAQASEDALRQQVGQAGILHIAAHGRYNRTNPLASLLTLAPSSGGETPETDGQLEAGEVYSLDLHKADLVVLSACQTDLGDMDELSAGDEVVGLTRAFFFAGAPTVVASLWPVDDAATGELMESFYRHLSRGLGKAAALQEAQREVRATKPAPYFWAGFVLAGDAGPISASSVATHVPVSTVWTLLAAASALLVGTIVTLCCARRRRL